MVSLRGLTLTAARPRIIVPLFARDPAVLCPLAKAAGADPAAELVELRLDPLPADEFLNALALVRGIVDKPLVVTIRTQAEGGEAALTADQYAAFCAAVCASGCADLLDIEFFSAGERLPQWIATAHAAGVKVVCSSHDFQKTPPRAELVERMVRMQQAGADLPKLAVMPTCRTDVLELLAATAEMADHHPETPVITMSMGALGAVSRLCGEVFGSAATFGMVGQGSAPGQIPADQLCHDLCQPRHRQRPRSGAAGCCGHRAGQPAALLNRTQKIPAVSR